MKRGKRFFENDNLFIYVGTAIFFVLAIALGIIMFMLNKTTSKLENGSGQVIQESQTGENAESVSTEIGKSIQEQEKSEEVKNEENNLNQIASNSNNSIDVTSSSEKKENTTNSVKTNGEINKADEPDTKSPDTNSSTDDNKKSNIIETKKEITFVRPTEGETICEYAKENLIYSETLKEWITHTAIDIKADKTSVIKASADGVVKSIVNDPRYGLTVVIEHDDGYETVYANLLTAEFVVAGEEVTQGQTIGTAGNTASFESSMECHLHFELIKDGEYLDPAIYLK